MKLIHAYKDSLVTYCGQDPRSVEMTTLAHKVTCFRCKRAEVKRLHEWRAAQDLADADV